MKITMVSWRTRADRAIGCCCSCGACGPMVNTHDCGRPACRSENQLMPIDDCKCHILPFDGQRVMEENMTSAQVRQLYPRFCGACSSCGYTGIAYASFEHYVYGDW
jgi:hypothetical protein